MRDICKRVLLRLTAILLGLGTIVCAPALGQKKSERFWLAGRYDGNRVVVYFDAVKFEGTMSSNARKIADPMATAFFNPVELAASYIARFQKKPNAEHFGIGDRYDLLLGNGTIATIKLTTLVGCETDEQVGNDSFIGALGTVEEGLSDLYERLLRCSTPSGATNRRGEAKTEDNGRLSQACRFRGRAGSIRHRNPDS